VPLIDTLPAPLEEALGVTNGPSDDLAVAGDLTLQGAR
jgi:hypothetical protein